MGIRFQLPYFYRVQSKTVELREDVDHLFRAIRNLTASVDNTDLALSALEARVEKLTKKGKK